MNYIIEIATTDFTTTSSAVKGGADRIELCSNLAEGGTTPSYGLIRQCRESFTVSLYPIIRPRGGDFLYTKVEYELMLKDALLCKELGCDGIVTGMLNLDGTVDIARTAEIIEKVYPLGVTFHRAFDRCREPFQALEDLVQIGCERILSSGQQPAAPEGASLLAELNQRADYRIIIMPGSGVRKENIKQLAEITACTDFHSSLRSKEKSRMQFIHPAFRDSGESYTNNSIDPAEVMALRKALSS